MKILLVEDDTKVAKFLTRVLTEEGYKVDRCKSGREALTQVTSGLYDLIVLDWMLPDVDGLSVCRETRGAGVTAPILMLTARGETKERVLGLDAGADDYLVKPFEVEEFVARVRALLRRAKGVGKLKCGKLEVDRFKRCVFLAGQPLVLTSKEFSLLLHLMYHTDKVVTRTELLTHVWDTQFDPGSNLVEVHISRLREKFGEHAWMIETVRGVGYRLIFGGEETR